MFYAQWFLDVEDYLFIVCAIVLNAFQNVVRPVTGVTL